MKKRIMAFCMAFMLCLTGISDYVISRAEDDSKQNVALKSNNPIESPEWQYRSEACESKTCEPHRSGACGF